jgi:structural maintenance of chromosome 3 (chondroitin sulfate proteoglycan 6)
LSDTLHLSRQDAQSELTDLVRSRTELECIVEDLQTAGLRAGGKREQLDAELAQVAEKITEKENALEHLIPEWKAQRALEGAEKRKLDEANARLGALFAKQGRATKFRTKAERDTFLQREIASMNAYQKSQTAALEITRVEGEAARRSQQEIEEKIVDVQGKIEDGRTRVRDLGEQSVALKDQRSELTERRKELWREDTKLESLVRHAGEELKSAERYLASMMDKVCFCLVQDLWVS